MLVGNVNLATRTMNLSLIAKWLGFENPENFLAVFPILYIIVCLLTILVFNLGFARKLPLLKLAIVYLALLLGNVLLSFLALTLPIVESLTVAALVLIIYKLRLRNHKRDEALLEK